MSIFLVRHGVTDWNQANRVQGHTDIGLNSHGLRQVAELEGAFRHLQVDHLFSSDLVRCQQTAAPILAATQAPIKYSELLRERSFGHWEGDSYDDIHRKMREAGAKLGLDEFFVRAEGGESLKDVWDRLDPIVEEIASTPGNLCVVSHGGVCAILLSRLVQGTYDTPKSFRFENASVTQLERRPNGAWRLVRFCDVSHLDGLEN